MKAHACCADTCMKAHACCADTCRRGRAEQREAPRNRRELGTQEKVELRIREVERRKGLAGYLLRKAGSHKCNCVQNMRDLETSEESELALSLINDRNFCISSRRQE